MRTACLTSLMPCALVPAFAFIMAPAHAGRPMVTDDAGIVEHRACQLETWVQRNNNGTEYWAVPACNVTGNWEVALGGARFHDADGRQTIGLAQAKTLFKPLEANGWGVGLVFGDRFITRQNVNGDLFAFVPVSLSFLNDRFLLHANLGWQHERRGSRDVTTWAVASDMQIAPRARFSLEAFGQGSGTPYYQLAVRYWLSPEQVQLDATYGDRIGQGSRERWFSIGLKFVMQSILP